MFPKYQVLVGDCISRLKDIPDNSVQCCITSPPYYGLRSYGTTPQIWGGDPACEHEWGDAIPENSRHRWTPEQCGKEATVASAKNYPAVRGAFCLKCGAWLGDLGLEPTPEMYALHLVEIFREVRRVLRKDGTLWFNIGDSYNGSGGAGGDYGKGGLKEGQPKYPGRHIRALKPKDLVGIPWMLAFALRADGWYLRSDIIWSKKNCMPESVTDRPTKSHEYVFLMAKSGKYYFDRFAIAEPGNPNDHRGISGKQGAFVGKSQNVDTSKMNRCFRAVRETRNPRSVWTISTQPYSGAHFAVMPTELAKRCIKAGTSEKGCCPTCGKPWTRVLENGNKVQQHRSPGTQHKAIAAKGKHGATSVIETGFIQTSHTIGWKPSCKCPEHEPIPCTVLDPFFGAGTTALAAWEQGQSCIGVELNPKYAELAQKRLAERLGIVGLMEGIEPDVDDGRE